MERPNIGIRYRKFFYDIEGKTYDIVSDIVPDIVYHIGIRYIGIRYRRFSYDIEGKNYDIVHDIVYDIVYDIVFSYLTCHISDAGPSLQIPGNSGSDLDADRQMDADDLRIYQDQLVITKTNISRFLADMPSTMHSFQDDMLRAIDAFSRSCSTGPVSPRSHNTLFPRQE